MKYQFEKQGNYMDSREIIPDGHLLDKFSEPMSERTAFVKCMCDCPIKLTCKRWTDIMPKHRQTLGKPFITKGNEFFCEFFIALDGSGFHKPFKTELNQH